MNYKRFILITVISLLCSVSSKAQDTLSGIVMGREAGKEVPLPYASLRWMNTTRGAVAGADGKFKIALMAESRTLIVSYTGFKADTFVVNTTDFLKVVLNSNNELNEAVVHDKGKSTTISGIGNMKVEVLGKGELRKAACCNLSESFETNPTIEASFTDALTGIRQIQMLGLSGVYAQTLVENMPMIHGMNAGTGLSFIPGPFVESIQLSKGVGSAMYGYESMSGQINIELIKPELTDKFFLNGYQNVFGRSELNAITGKKINDKWSTNVMAHANLVRNKMDPNKDGFLNMPSGEGVNLVNRYKYQGKNWEGMFGVRLLHDNRISGQQGYERGMARNPMNPYGIEYLTNQAGAWAKFGRMASEERPTSIGFIFNANRYENKFLAGLKDYHGLQNSLYGAMVFNRNIEGKKVQSLSGGISLFADDYDEKFMANRYRRTEIIPGIFGEYSYEHNSKLSFVVGARADYHNLFGAFFTPRFHVRYAPTLQHTFRASAGRGQRTANVFSENMAIFVSSRDLVSNTQPYTGVNGLQPEVSWNYGANYTFTKAFSKNRSAQISLDYYYVHFVNQAVIDTDSSARSVYIYNLRGLSYSHTFQAQITVEPIERLELRMAYRYLDVRTEFTTGLRQRSLIAPHRGFFNAAYSTKNKWVFDLTAQVNGKRRLPDMVQNPEDKRFDSHSPTYVIVHAQISKQIKKWEIYAGGENLLNVMQRDLIIDAINPYGQYFDASMVWGPAMGAMGYLGFRYTLN